MDKKLRYSENRCWY